MNKSAARPDDTVSQVDELWQQRVDALISGACSEEDFLAELSSLRQSGADSAWGVIALLDQRYRRGHLPHELFRSIEAKIARRELGPLDYETTIELDVDLEPHAARREITPTDTVEILIVDAPTARTETAAPAERLVRDRYVLEKQLGDGMGTVFKAVDRYRSDLPQASRIVAIKFLHEAAGHPEAVSKLRREFYRAQALSHPNIVKVYELDRDGDIEFFTMEFLDGELLSSVSGKLQPAPLSRPRAWAIIRDVAAGLAHAHSRGVVHGDLKPRNIMITASGETRILDFGAASGELAQKSNSNATTPAYASCEVLEGQSADPRDDLFALACLAYELLAGQHPFQRRRSTAARDLGLTARRPRNLTRQQWRTLQLGLAWRREDRSMSVGEWVARLGADAAAQRRAHLLSRTPVAWALLIAVVASAAFFGRQLFERKGPDAAALSPRAAQLPDTPGTMAPDAPAAPPVLAAPASLTGPVSLASPQAAAPASPAAAPASSTVSPTPSPTAAPASATASLTASQSVSSTASPAVSPRASPAASSTASLAISPAVSPSVSSTASSAVSPTASPMAVPTNDLPAASASAQPPPSTARRGSAPAPKAPDAIGFSAGYYKVRVHQNFAEIHVIRPRASGGDTTFAWWTEPGSALPGTDYVAQGRTIQLLSSHSQMESLFVKLVPNVSRKHSAAFYVVIGEPSNGVSLGRVTRTAVMLPPQ